MVDILAIGAHPDDIEFACGGILCKTAAAGKSIAMADLTFGDKATHGTPVERRLESENAAAVIGAKRIFLNFKDCEIFDTYEGRLQIVRLIRKEKPRLVLAPYWKGEQNHPDHLACGQMVRYACRYARFANILPDLPAHWVEGVLHYAPPTMAPVDFLVDVSEHVETWTKMMLCHGTQMQTFPYDEWNLRIASKWGVMIGCSYAQALIKGNPVVVEDVMSVSRGTREI